MRIARSWIGVPFAHQGRTRRGIDCVGLIVVVADAMGVTGVDIPGYTRRSYGDEFLVPFKRYARHTTFQKIQIGDIVVFHSRVYPCHTGILAKNAAGAWTVIHAVANLRKVFETPWAGQWQEAARHIYSFPNVTP